MCTCNNGTHRSSNQTDGVLPRRGYPRSLYGLKGNIPALPPHAPPAEGGTWVVALCCRQGRPFSHSAWAPSGSSRATLRGTQSVPPPTPPLAFNAHVAAVLRPICCRGSAKFQTRSGKKDLKGLGSDGQRGKPKVGGSTLLARERGRASLAPSHLACFVCPRLAVRDRALCEASAAAARAIE